jgi:hypothetical protein
VSQRHCKAGSGFFRSIRVIVVPEKAEFRAMRARRIDR